MNKVVLTSAHYLTKLKGKLPSFALEKLLLNESMPYPKHPCLVITQAELLFFKSARMEEFTDYLSQNSQDILFCFTQMDRDLVTQWKNLFDGHYYQGKIIGRIRRKQMQIPFEWKLYAHYWNQLLYQSSSWSLFIDQQTNKKKLKKIIKKLELKNISLIHRPCGGKHDKTFFITKSAYYESSY